MSRWSAPARWAVPVVLVLVLASLPWAVGRWQARSSAAAAAMPAAQVLALAQGARDTPWSGNAESRGGLALPVTDVLSELTDLAGSTTTVRAWWSDPLSWRVDELNPVGELDTIRDSGGSWAWDYQKGEATRTRIDGDPRVRLPQIVDLLPPTLAARLLSEALPSEASRFDGGRIAGRETLGLRITPAGSQATVARVDVWVDSATGLPLRVEIAADGATTPAITSTFLDVDIATPDRAQLDFTPPADADVRFQDDPRQADLASAVDRYAPVQNPPDTLAGLPRSDRTPDLGAVGVYGRGVTELVVVPLSVKFAGGLRDQLAAAASEDAAGRLTLGVGPLNLLVTDPGPNGRFWLLAGTVTPATLTAAAGELPDAPVGRR